MTTTIEERKLDAQLEDFARKVGQDVKGIQDTIGSVTDYKALFEAELQKTDETTQETNNVGNESQ